MQDAKVDKCYIISIRRIINIALTTAFSEFFQGTRYPHYQLAYSETQEACQHCEFSLQFNISLYYSNLLNFGFEQKSGIQLHHRSGSRHVWRPGCIHHIWCVSCDSLLYCCARAHASHAIPKLEAKYARIHTLEYDTYRMFIALKSLVFA